MRDTVLVTEFDWPMWRNHRGEEFTSSPSHQIRAARLTAPYTDWPWQMAAHEDPFAMAAPDWTAYFSWESPREIVAGFHRAVGAMFAGHERIDHPGPGARPHGFESTVAPLLEAGWRHRAVGNTLGCTSPDGLVALALNLDADDPGSPRLGWTIDVRDQIWRWGAAFGRWTPPALIRATVQSVVDPAPVTRRRSELPDELGPAATLTPVPATHPQGVAIPRGAPVTEVAPSAQPGRRRR